MAADKTATDARLQLKAPVASAASDVCKAYAWDERRRNCILCLSNPAISVGLVVALLVISTVALRMFFVAASEFRIGFVISAVVFCGRLLTRPGLGQRPSVSNRSLKRPLPTEADAQVLLAQFLDIVDCCSSVHLGQPAVPTHGLNVNCVIDEPGRSVWMASSQDSPLVFICAQNELRTNAPAELILNAIYNPDERLRWDGSSLYAFEVLTQPIVESGGARHDMIYCGIPLPPGLPNRDLVQERFLIRLPGDGYAILMHAASEASSAALGKSPSRGIVRATTHLSGYLIQPQLGGGTLVTALSQMDAGGKLPYWLQRMATKLSKRRPLEWAQRLETYCNSIDAASRV